MDNESSSDYFTSSDTDELVDSFDSGMQKLTLRGNGVNSIDGGNFTRFHGKSSNMRLIDATRKFRERHMQKTLSEPGDSDTATSSSGSSGLPESGRRSEFWQPPQVSTFSSSVRLKINHTLGASGSSVMKGSIFRRHHS